MKIVGKRLIVRAWNADGYHKDILVQNERQVLINESRVKGGQNGSLICPADFPEMTHFEVILENVYE